MRKRRLVSRDRWAHLKLQRAANLKDFCHIDDGEFSSGGMGAGFGGGSGSALASLILAINDETTPRV